MLRLSFFGDGSDGIGNSFNDEDEQPSNSTGVRIFPTISTIADSLTQSRKMTAKKSAENSHGLMPEKNGDRDIS